MSEPLKVNDRELEAVLALDAPDRLSYFVKKVSDWQQAWGLWYEGWAQLVGAESSTCLPLWPARQYAECCACKDWSLYGPRAIAIDDLMKTVLVELQEEGGDVAVFPDRNLRCEVLVPEGLAARLQAELDLYQ